MHSRHLSCCFRAITTCGRTFLLTQKKTIMAASVGTLEDQAKKRKERLAALKSKRGPDTSEDEPANKKVAGQEEKLPKPVFRSYKPSDESLKESLLPAPKLPDVDDKVQDQLAASKPEPLMEEVDLVNLAPRKPDWDLRRDIAKKLEKLERRTQRSIAELIRDRIQGGQTDLAAAVNAFGAEPTEDDD